MMLHKGIGIKYIFFKSQKHAFFDFFRVILINDFNQTTLITISAGLVSWSSFHKIHVEVLPLSAHLRAAPKLTIHYYTWETKTVSFSRTSYI